MKRRKQETSKIDHKAQTLVGKAKKAVSIVLIFIEFHFLICLRSGKKYTKND